MLRKTKNRDVQAAKRNKVGPPGQKGQSLVEMAIITPLLLLMFIGVVEVGWAIRGYIVLVNADREATRFAARGQYLDFAQTERENVGYDWVLVHTLDSISEQLDYDVASGDPNGTLIISHYLVDTGQPCEDPPCNDDCAADKHNKHGGCDCSTPERREEDYPLDDLILHPGMEGYEHFTALYGIPRESQINPDELVAQLKEQNDAFNCSLNVKDESVPWVPNSVVAVETWYDQPQLLGVPLVSNYLTDPIPMYAQTAMRITASRGKTMSNGEGCHLLPITVHRDAFKHPPPPKGDGELFDDINDKGTEVLNIRQGIGSGNFGWLRWTDDSKYFGSTNNEQYLAEALFNPYLAVNDYMEPEHKDLDAPPVDTVINKPDWIWGMTGNVNSDGVARTQLERLKNDDCIDCYRIPVYDDAEGTGSNVVYRIYAFAKVKITGYDLTGYDKVISAEFWGWDDGCRGNGH
jgi:hypothetical protein